MLPSVFRRYAIVWFWLSRKEMLAPPEEQFGEEGFALQAYSVPVRMERDGHDLGDFPPCDRRRRCRRWGTKGTRQND